MPRAHVTHIHLYGSKLRLQNALYPKNITRVTTSAQNDDDIRQKKLTQKRN